MKTTVVNVWTQPFDVYIGRSGRGFPSLFGNPFYLGTREENIMKFREYFINKVNSNPHFKEEVLKLKGKALGCFCAPKPCHGDVIKEYLDNV